MAYICILLTKYAALWKQHFLLSMAKPLTEVSK
nr:MAG TPA: hypothetical protein [Caudoviricetes sp.]